MKIGIMGGTFDPIHFGHLNIANAAFEEYSLDKLIFMTAGDPYFKQGSGVSSPEIRYEMTKLGTADYPHFECSDMEIKAKGHTYTAETLIKLSELYPADKLFFIMGFDSLKYLDKWYRPETILEKAVILCALRDGSGIAEAEELISELKRKYSETKADIRMIHTPLIDISSTMIRKMVNKDEDISALVPVKVRDFIISRKLYKKLS